MASVKNLKKQINYTLGDIIGECYELKADAAKSEAIVDEAISVFDTLIEKVNSKSENKKAHFKAISAELASSAEALRSKIAAL